MFSEAQEPIELQRLEKYLQIFFFKGVIYHGLSAPNPQSSLFIENEADTAFENLKWMDELRFSGLPRLETTNWNEWEGKQPLELKSNAGAVLWKENTVWDVRTVDPDTMRPVRFLLGHVSRDYAFQIQQRLQAAFDYASTILADWEDVAKRHNDLDANSPDELPPEHQEEGQEMMRDIIERIEENPPAWQW